MNKAKPFNGASAARDMFHQTLRSCRVAKKSFSAASSCDQALGQMRDKLCDRVLLEILRLLQNMHRAQSPCV